MAQFYKPKAKKTSSAPVRLALTIEKVDHLGMAISHHQGKVIFVDNALVGEQVQVQITEQKKQYAKAKLLKVTAPSAARIQPQCEHYQQCGGCDFQYLDIEAQRESKQQALQDLLTHLTKQPLSLMPAMTDQAWHYRRRARLSTWYDKNNKQVRLGFRQASSNKLCEINHCAVLAEPLSALIPALRVLLNRMSSKSALGHVELLQLAEQTIVVLRLTKLITDKDLALLKQFEIEQQLQLLVQDNDNHCVDLNEQAVILNYQVNEQVLGFKPGNFIQVNDQINQAMVAQAIDWLAPQADELILDLFCGVGNFSLPLAAKGAQVIGVEGVPAMVAQASANAMQAGLSNVAFYHADLNSETLSTPWLTQSQQQGVDKVLLDPARAGALEAMAWIVALAPKKVVYVSCNPVSLARDAKVLLAHGYQLVQANLLDMFPQTHHIESMALFERIKS